MAFPSPPVYPVGGGAIDLPRWCYGTMGAVYSEPPTGQQQTGWTAVPGQNYGQIPPYQWFNWWQLAVGEYTNYFNNCMNYISTGKYLIQQIVLNSITGGSLIITSATTLLFTNIAYTNVIGASPYDVTTGNFIAPVNGAYRFQFSLSMVPSPDSSPATLSIAGASTNPSTNLTQNNLLVPVAGSGGYTATADVYFFNVTAGDTLLFQYDRVGGGSVEVIFYNLPGPFFASNLTISWYP